MNDLSLSGGPGISVSYGFDSTPNPTRIFFRIRASNNGWIALAIASSTSSTVMGTGDMMILRAPEGQILLEDRKSTS